MNSSPAIVNGRVYVGSNGHNLYALNATSGAKVWSFSTGNAVLSSPAVANGVVYVGSYNGNVCAIGNAAAATSHPVACGQIVFNLARYELLAYSSVFYMTSKEENSNGHTERISADTAAVASKVQASTGLAG